MSAWTIVNFFFGDIIIFKITFTKTLYFILKDNLEGRLRNVIVKMLNPKLETVENNCSLCLISINDLKI